MQILTEIVRGLSECKLVGEIKTHREAVCPNRACTDL